MTKFTRDSAVGFLKAINENIPSDIKMNKYLLRSLSKARVTLGDILKEIGDRETALNTENVKAYEESRIAIIKKYAVKDETGEVILEDGNATIPKENTEDAAAEIKAIYEKYDMATAEEERKKFIAFIQEEIDVDLVKVSIDQIPDELNTATYQILSLFIEE